MIDLLGKILCALQKLAYAIVDLVVFAINGLIAAIGAVLGVIIAALPGMPAVPTIDWGQAGAVIAYCIPIAPILAIYVGLLGTYVVWLGIRVVARWVKLL